MTFTLRSSHSKGILLLILTTIIWGTSFSLLKHTLGSLSPGTILAIRFGIAAIAVAPWLRKLDRRLIQDGLLLGGVYFAECACALIGLETISASRSAVILSLNVILVPLLAGVLGQKLSGRVVLAAAIAVLGIGIMSWEGAGLSQGDILTIVCAVGIAVYILMLEAIAPRHSTLPLVAVQLVTAALLGLVFSLSALIQSAQAVQLPFEEVSSNLGSLVYLGIVVTATPIWTQAMAQRWVPAHEAALLYTLEPVFAALFSFWFLGEGFGIRGLIGAGLILAATLYSQRLRP
ncbi:DMT family transporter [Leptolyngbya ohadii]|uniref:DMT family transporter n=1 Tax=Leptolyngbya ohadii TaxID=1962290 RepID=UPI0015C62837|nr:DMT family transporter [Leptolyngbya ohadii]